MNNIHNFYLTLSQRPHAIKGIFVWKSASYKGYIIPINTIINEERYFCRNYMEVLIRRSEYNIYENKACRDHDGECIWFETTSANKSN
jgi:surface antigen